MKRTDDIQHRVLHRLKISRGQLNKVIKMVEDQDYCIDILHQSQAIEKALKETDSLILENHLKTCVVEQLQKGKREAVSEVMNVFRKTNS